MENSVENVETVAESSRNRKPMLISQNSTLDDKGRINIPAKFRDALDGGFVLMKHSDRRVKCLLIFVEDEFERFYAKLKAKPNVHFSQAMRFLQVNRIEPKQGRFVVPPILREYAGLEDELVLIGMGDTAEVWSKSEYEKNDVEEMGDNLDEILGDI
ncbi:MAG: division/cell wall cluster transcriptional repressor MraZ [Oscillospiraceae bacterium]|nr:division/cell wall cluster transcriptional repressor MraZ [Oscillospiraceae bacterium]